MIILNERYATKMEIFTLKRGFKQRGEKMLSHYSMDELQGEIDRRRMIQKKPVPVNNSNYTELRQLCLDYIDQVSRLAVDDDLEHHVFEAALEAVYGEDIWGYINRLT